MLPAAELLDGRQDSQGIPPSLPAAESLWGAPSAGCPCCCCFLDLERGVFLLPSCRDTFLTRPEQETPYSPWPPCLLKGGEGTVTPPGWDAQP